MKRGLFTKEPVVFLNRNEGARGGGASCHEVMIVNFQFHESRKNQ